MPQSTNHSWPQIDTRREKKQEQEQKQEQDEYENEMAAGANREHLIWMQYLQSLTAFGNV